MDRSLYEFGSASAATHFKQATLAVFQDLNGKYPQVPFDELHRVSARAMELHIAANGFAKKIWEQSLPYEKAEGFLISQFPEIPPEICAAALSKGYVDRR